MPMVFVVDDQMYIRKVLELGLQEKGFSVRGFESGKELIQYLSDPSNTEKPDVILLDIMMPDMDGFEVMVRLNQMPSASKIPIMIISARNQKEDVLKALKLGAKDFIVKPFDMEKVVEKISNVIG